MNNCRDFEQALFNNVRQFLSLNMLFFLWCQVGGESWLRIAWAFLRAGGERRRREREGGEGGSETSEMGEGERRNVGKLCRLQLYCYPKHRLRRRAVSSISEV